MPFVVRDKMTGEIIKMCSGKSVWAKAGHAKASFKTSGLYAKDEEGVLKLYGGRRSRFDDQSRFEIVETLDTNPKTEEIVEILKALLPYRGVVPDHIMTRIDKIFKEC